MVNLPGPYDNEQGSNTIHPARLPPLHLETALGTHLCIWGHIDDGVHFVSFTALFVKTQNPFLYQENGHE